MSRNTGPGDVSRPMSIVKHQDRFFRYDQGVEVPLKHEPGIRQCRKRRIEATQHCKVTRNCFVENSQQKTRNMCNTQRCPNSKKWDLDVLSEADGDGKSLQERDSHFDDSRTSSDFIGCFRTSRARPKPDPDVYDWPKEWLPKPSTPLVPANTSALTIDPPKSKPPCHVFENTFYLQSPPKMRSEMEPWKLNFDYNPDVEMARMKKIRKAEKQLLDTVPQRRRTNTEKMEVKVEAERMVDIEEYIERTSQYHERKKTDLEIMRRVYRERDLGTPLDTDDIVEMAMDIKYKVYLKSMKASHPGYQQSNTTNPGDTESDFTIPNEDTITAKSRKITNQIFRKTESALERDLGVVTHGSKARTGTGVNHMCVAYENERGKWPALNSYNNCGFRTNRMEAERGSTSVQSQTANGDGGQRMTLWYGQEGHKRLQQYVQEKCHTSISGCSSVEKMDCSTDQYRYGESENDKEFGVEKILSRPRMTLWYGYRQRSGDEEVMNSALAGSKKRKFVSDGEEELLITKDRSRFRDGEHGWIATEKDVMENAVKMNPSGLEGTEENETINCEKEIDAEDTLTRTVPFLYLSTEDLPHNIRMETLTFTRSPPQSTNTMDRFLYNPQCVIL